MLFLCLTDPDRSLGSPLRFEDIRFGAIYLVFKERPFDGSTLLTTGELRIRLGYGGIKGPPTIRAGCAFALNFRARPKTKTG